VLPQPDPEIAVAHGLFSARQAVDAGYSHTDITRQVRRGRWVRVRRGVLMAVGHDMSGEDEVLLALLDAGPSAVLIRRSAARVYGWDLLVDPGRPELALHDRPRRSLGLVFRTVLPPDDVIVVGLLRVTTPERTVLDLAALLPATEAVVAVDAAYRAGVPTEAVEAAWRSWPPCRRRAEARRTLELANPLSGSVPETEMRLLVVRSGLPMPVSQFEVWVDGELIGRVDFAWVEQRLVLEVDGFAYHHDRVAFQRDRTRQNALIRAGWRVLRFTVDDVRLRPDEVLAEIREALA
jgi:hypothetical protein